MVVVSSVNPDQSFLPDTNPVSPPNYLAWRNDTRLFADMAAADEYRTGSLSAGGQAGGDPVRGSHAELLSLCSASHRHWARSFVAGEDQAGRDHVVILSHGLWERRFGSDPSVIGRSIRLNREEYTIVGVMAADFRLLGFIPQLWTPLVLTGTDRDRGCAQ